MKHKSAYAIRGPETSQSRGKLKRAAVSPTIILKTRKKLDGKKYVAPTDSNLSIISRRGLYSPELLRNESSYEELMKIVGVKDASNSIFLPENLDELHKISQNSNEPRAIFRSFQLEKTDIKYDRKDVNALSLWLETMLTQAYEKYSENPDLLYETTSNIYNACFEEIIKQINVNCRERGVLMEKIWKADQELFDKTLKIARTKEDYQREIHTQEMEKIKEEYETKLADNDKVHYADERKIDALNRASRQREDALKVKNIREERLMARLATVQQHYKSIKREIYILKEENRILQTKLNTCDFEVLENKNGYLLPIDRAILRIKRRQIKQLENEIKNDPVLLDSYKINFNAENSLQSEILQFGIEYTETYENALFSRPDYTHKGTDAPVTEIEDTSVQTNVTELCGESIGIKKRVRNQVHTSTVVLRKQSTLEKAFELDTVDEDPNFFIIEEENGLLEKIKKHQKIKSLIHRFQDVIYTQNLQSQINFENMPHRQVMNLLAKNLETALNVVRTHPLETKELSHSESEDSELDSEHLKYKKKGFLTLIKRCGHDQNVLTNNISAKIYRVANTPIHKLKKIMFKRTLLKLITYFYEKREKNNPKVSLSKFIYDSLLQKYIMVKAVNNRFEYILSSCMKYRCIPRVRLFGRFLNLYNSLSLPDLVYFFECRKILFSSLTGKNVQNSEDSETVLVPYIRCVECLKSYESHFTEVDLKDIKSKLTTIKFPDKTGNNKQGLVLSDDFLEIFIDKLSQRRTQKLDFLRHLFEAADLNNDGYIEFSEFNLLVKHFSHENYTANATKEIFKSSCEKFLGEDDIGIEAISLENMPQLNFNYEIFKREHIEKVSGVRTGEEALEKLIICWENIDFVLGEIYWRFSECEKWVAYLPELHNLIELLKIRIYQRQNPYVEWLSFRLLEEESKCELISEKVKGFLPLVSLCR